MSVSGDGRAWTIERWYLRLRRATIAYPFLRGTRRVSRLLGGLTSGRSAWLTTPDNPFLPRLVLNVGSEFQRRLYLFPKAYGRLYMRSELITVMTRELCAGGVFLDIGSNVGVYSMIAAPMVGSTGHVYSFEPDTTAYEALQRSAAANGFAHLTALNVAVSDQSAAALLYRDAPGSTASSLVGFKEAGQSGRGDIVRVQVVRLDDALGSMELDPARIQLIKIDVEGAEAKAVRGMLRTLSVRTPPVFCEVRGPKGSERAPNTFEEVVRLLSPLGYRPFYSRVGVETPAESVVYREDILFRRP